ncbi:hypothetical protein BH11PLA2_BH11PLA2_23250 [soil metagenome]
MKMPVSIQVALSTDGESDPWEACLWLGKALDFEQDAEWASVWVTAWSDAEDASERKLFAAIRRYGRTGNPRPLAAMLTTIGTPEARKLARVFAAMAAGATVPRFVCEIDQRLFTRIGRTKIQGVTIFQHPARGGVATRTRPKAMA